MISASISSNTVSSHYTALHCIEQHQPASWPVEILWVTPLGGVNLTPNPLRVRNSSGLANMSPFRKTGGMPFPSFFKLSFSVLVQANLFASKSWFTQTCEAQVTTYRIKNKESCVKNYVQNIYTHCYPVKTEETPPKIMSYVYYIYYVICLYTHKAVSSHHYCSLFILLSVEVVHLSTSQ